MSNVKALVCALAMTASCAKNPALSPKPNGAPLTVVGDERLWDGNPVDEQDYYHLAGDKESEEVIRKKRAKGKTLQTAGGIVMVSGLLLAAGGVAAWQLGGDSYMKPGLIGAAIALGVGFFTGKALIKEGNHTVRGEDGEGNKVLVFDHDHAQKAVERGTFGAAGLTTASMKTLELHVDDPDGPTLCVGGHLTVEAKVTDATGAQVAQDRLKDVVEWTTTLEPDPKHDYSITLDDNSLTNPSLWTQPIEVTAHLVGNEAVKAHMTVTRTFRGCQTASIGDRLGEGQAGRSGFSGNYPGEQGAKGEDGKDGGDGGHRVAEAAWVKTSIAPKVLLVVGEYGEWSLGSRGSVTAAGQRGGTGGKGGKGGDAYNRPGADCADTGHGGYGGDGGNGGDGGVAELRYASDDILEHVRLDAPAGSGGSGGEGGDPGKDCDGELAGRGNKGMAGRDGKPGKDGSTKTTKVPLAKLAWIKKFLAEHPELTLVDDEPVAPRKPR